MLDKLRTDIKKSGLYVAFLTLEATRLQESLPSKIGNRRMQHSNIEQLIFLLNSCWFHNCWPKHATLEMATETQGG